MATGYPWCEAVACDLRPGTCHRGTRLGVVTRNRYLNARPPTAAGANLGMPLLGKLTQGIPADVIAVRGNALERLKLLEYPDLVISGGRVIVNHFE